MSLVEIPFCKPDYASGELQHLQDAIADGRLEGGGRFTQSCETMLARMVGCEHALVVPSCTAALEMMGMTLDLQPGDEVIMPSFTFVSTANAIALRGAVPVFVDIDPSTLNIDPDAAEDAVTSRTRAIMVVHYAGVGCEMQRFVEICRKNKLFLLEDAAQALGASWDGRPLGSFGDCSAISFHHTKNVSCGEGGAFLTNSGSKARSAEFIRDKGTNRADFLRGIESKYEWLVLGSSYLLSELTAAVLLGQLERSESLLAKRMRIWRHYYDALGALSEVRGPSIPEQASHNGHIFHLRMPSRNMRDALCVEMRSKGIMVSPHYVPLHLTPGGQRYGRGHGDLTATVSTCETLVRLPLFSAMETSQLDRVISEFSAFMVRHRLS